ncbi:hypothetical protein, partial [Staphylococcus aureus]
VVWDFSTDIENVENMGSEKSKNTALTTLMAAEIGTAITKDEIIHSENDLHESTNATGANVD